jgi:hypothetical protein
VIIFAFLQQGRKDYLSAGIRVLPLVSMQHAPQVQSIGVENGAAHEEPRQGRLHAAGHVARAELPDHQRNETGTPDSESL